MMPLLSVAAQRAARRRWNLTATGACAQASTILRRATLTCINGRMKFPIAATARRWKNREQWMQNTASSANHFYVNDTERPYTTAPGKAVSLGFAARRRQNSALGSPLLALLRHRPSRPKRPRRLATTVNNYKDLEPSAICALEEHIGVSVCDRGHRRFPMAGVCRR